MNNLNNAVYRYEEGCNELRPVEFEKNGVTSCPARVQVIFADHFAHLEQWLRGADIVVGVVAWLTNIRALTALARVPYGVNLIVNKEDWLRPDGQVLGWQYELRREYAGLPPAPQYEIAHGVSQQYDWSAAAVRCAGIFNRSGAVGPRVHHKFLVACKRMSRHDPENPHAASDSLEHWAEPVSVWTGSINLTWNAAKSLENAVIIHSGEVANAYFDVWSKVLLISEPLNWEHDYVSPELRIGS